MNRKYSSLEYVFGMLAFLVSMPLHAYDFQSGDIYYLIKGNQATVTYGSSSYQGRIEIPSQVTYDGKTYPVTSIGVSAFDGSSGITYLSIPSSITSIGEYAFIDCGSDMEVNVESLDSWCRISFGNEHSCPLSCAKEFCLNGSAVRELVIPDGITIIPNFAFYQCRSITSLTLSSSVYSIGSSAFENCTGLTSVDLSTGLSLIGGSSFEGCNALPSITFPGTVTSIAINAFRNCTSLNAIVSEIREPFAIDENVFSTYSTATLEVPYGTKAIYQATEGWSHFSVIIEGEGPVSFKKDGVTYETLTQETVEVKSVDASLVSIEIPASVSHEGKNYQVTGIEDNAFDGSGMAALIWNVEAALPSDAFSHANIGSNFLLYVKSASYAPSTVKNVVVDGVAQSVVLSDDGGQFYCPQAFTAGSISYAHNYSMETGGDGMGWETIALPFDVQRIEHSTKGEIVPFDLYNSSSDQKPFWLANFSGSGFNYTSAIKANEPYIIAMPNSSKYLGDYILAGDVTFSAENVSVPQTPTFNGAFLPAFAPVAMSASVHALNVNNRYVKYSGSYEPGSRFIAGLRDVRPFEAYISDGSTRGVIKINVAESATAIGRALSSFYDNPVVVIYTLSGQQVALSVQRGFDEIWSSLAKGVYIVNGKKMIK